MSYLLEILGRGMLGRLGGAFDKVLGLPCDETLEELAAAAEREPDNLNVRLRMGGLYLRRDDPAAARRVFQDILSADATVTAARVGLACALDDLGDIDAAVEQLRYAQRRDPNSPAILFCLGYCHERGGREEAAIRYYQDSVRLCPTLRNAHERLAALFLKQDELDLAVHHYMELCRLDPQHVDLHMTLANLLLKTGDAQAAIEHFEHVIAMEPDNWTARNDAIAAYEEAGLFREAIEHCHTMVEREPETADTRLRLGDLYARIGNDVAATTQYERAVELSPDFLEVYVRLGTQHLRGGRYQDAARSFALALELNDRLLSAYVGMGVAQRSAGRGDEAAAAFEMARDIEPNSTLLFSEVARMHLKASASEQADRYLDLSIHDDADEDRETVGPPEPTDLISEQIERHQRALRRRPNHADLHYRLGLLLRNRGQLDDAIRCFRKAVEINPSYMKALIKLGLALNEAGLTDEAVATFEAAMDLHPEYLDLHYQLGLLFAQRQQFELAIEQFEQAAEGNPQHVNFQANLALALQNMGLIDRARATWEIVCELAPDSAYADQARATMAEHRDRD
ncbi:MAG: tetratricopeptide repeat protein [Phycisphaerae bacterium]